MNNAIVIVAMLLVTLVGLLWFASMGSVAAVGVLFSLWTLLCVIVGAGIVAYVNRSRAQQEQENFINNAKENLAMMQAMQSIQNKQNQTIMSQLKDVAQLPPPSNNGSGFVIDDGVFDGIE